MADDETSGEEERAEAKKGPSSSPDKNEPLDYARREKASGPGYFTIYKKGQGYWTRMGTVIGAALIGGFTAYNLYAYLPTFLPESVNAKTGREIGLGVAVGFLLAFALLCWRLLNRPTNVDFLIATDSEMKKVNWTSRRELIGSTRVVILFMFVIALFLFFVDQIFGWLMYAIKVLKVSPFGT